MNENSVLITGLRLLIILKALVEGDKKKSEILELYPKYGLKAPSGETLKLDINTLIKGGFDIKRGSKKNDYKLHLEEKYLKFGLTDEEYKILNAIKMAVLDGSNYRAILYLRDFYEELSNLISDKSLVFDFGFFNCVDIEMVDIIEDIIKSKNRCIIKYESQKSFKKEQEITPLKIYVHNKKLYLSAFAKERLTFRFDNIKEVIKVNKNAPAFFDTNGIKYQISKEYYNKFPLKDFENVINQKENKFYIEALDTSEFFVVQHLISMGKGCVGIENLKIKNLVIKNLENALENYK